MKDFLRIMLLAMMVCCWSCSGGREDVPTHTPTPKPEEKPKIEVTTTTPVLAQEGETATVTFTSTDSWTLDVTEGRAVSWCSVSPTSGGKGTNTLTIKTTANDTYDERNAKVTIKAGTTTQSFVVTQKQKDGLTVTSNKVEVGAEGGDISIEVKANVSVTFEIEESAKDWITANESRGLTTKTLKFNAKANDKTERRQGNIILKGGDGLTEIVTVYQAGEELSLVLTTEKDMTIGSDGGTLKIELQSNSEIKMEELDVDWLHQSSSRTMSVYTYYIEVDANETYDERNASITFISGDKKQIVTVTQKQMDALIVNSNKVEIGADGGDFSIEAKANVSVTFEIEESAKDWITASESRGLIDKTLSFTAKSNDKTERRQGNIILKGGDGLTETITIYQDGEKPSLVVSSDDVVVKSEGETIKIELKSNVEYSMVLPDVDWISKEESRAMSAYTHHLAIAQNETYDHRSAIVYFHNETENLKDSISITQLQKDAIIVAKNEYEVASEGGKLDFSINTNVDFEVSTSVDWIKQNRDSRGLVEKTLSFTVEKNEDKLSRNGDIVITHEGLKQTIKVIQKEYLDNKLIEERNTLIAFYKALNGDNWKTKNNWCSDRPLNEWSDVRVNEDGYVVELSFNYNNMQGSIPKCIGQLSHLKKLDMYGCGIVGPLPDELADCKHLQSIELGNNPLTGAVIPEYWGKHMQKLEYLGIYNTELGGELPRSIGGMKSLKNLFLASNKITGTIPESIGQLPVIEELRLSGNNLTGSIPESMVNLPKLKDFSLHSNNFQGSIPKAFQQTDNWKNFWPNILDNNEFDISNVRFYGPSFKDVKTLDGKTISDDIYSKNKLTILCTWLEWGGTEYLDALKEMYAKYKDMGLEIICYSKERDINVIKDFMQKNSIEWTTFSVEENKDKFLLKNTYYPFANIIAPNGEIIDTSVYNSIEYQFPKDLFIELEYDKYESTDYSKDGEVKKLQTATKGNGIDIILMGDAFSDRQIADGTYDRVMNTAMEKFFVEEPYKSFRDHFNVYRVTTVSKHDIYGELYGQKYKKYSESALDCFWGVGSFVGGDDFKVQDYAEKTGIDNFYNSTIIVIMNSAEYAGTCYMFEPMPEDISTDWGNGQSIAYFPMGENDETLGQVLSHEAGGHGFAKLGDEYAYQEYGAIPSDELQSHKEASQFGWWKNVDFTDNPTQVKWYHFLRDNRYDKDGLGVYEGGLTYWTGVWRATENSIMRYNTGGFNAPSREAIYYRIHKMAYGADWQYDYEKFVEYDAINRKESARSVNYVEVPKNFKPLHAPIIKRYTKKHGK